MISSLNLRVSWKPVNPQECVWENLCPNIMRTISQKKVTIHYSITIWDKFIPMPQAMKIPAAKAAVDGRDLKRFRRGTQQKSETNQR